MAKVNQMIFVCSNCGEEYLKWQGKCDVCGNWNTLKEFKSAKKQSESHSLVSGELIQIENIKITNNQRIKTISEFDRVLGGGIVPGSIILLGGDPGIGKSTLILEITGKIDNCLYVAGEESAQQIKLRFDRLGIKSKKLSVYPETDVLRILQTAKNEKPDLLIIDSIQTVYSGDFPSTPGSLVQVRESSLKFQQFAKQSGIPVILIGHVTKDGAVAGPRILEHLVDVVLYLEGDEHHNHRILRGAKNRFGATDEIGIFEMTEKGLEEILNPSKLFLEERLKKIPGTVVTAMVEGTRSLLVEVQALTTTTVFGYPQRRSSGFDLNRLQLLIAVLQKRANLNLANQDVFINVVGGVKIKEPAIDLAVAMAIASSFKNIALDSKLCVFGELGLSGEIRKVTHEKKRLTEANRLNYTKFITERTIGELVRKYFV